MLKTYWQNSKLLAVFGYIFVTKKADEKHNQQFCSRNAQTGRNQQFLRVVQNTQKDQTVRNTERSDRICSKERSTAFLRNIRECPPLCFAPSTQEKIAYSE
jgi:hypothetical protein